MKQLIILLALLIAHICARAQQNKEQVKQLDSIFQFMYEQHQFNGTVLIAEKGKILYNKGFGNSNEISKTKNNDKTIYELASCSKQFTAAAIVLLKRNNLINYEDNIIKYIPELPLWADVRIIDLIRHSSGIPEYLIDFPPHLADNKIATNQELIDFYASRKDTLQFTPNSKHRYNNTNYALLATIIERVSGQTFSEYLADNIFKPLHMKHTFVYNQRLSPRKVRNHAIGYVWAKNSFDKVIHEDPKYHDLMPYKLDGIVGNAKVNSTAEDIYKWINALKSNKFFTPEEFELMTSIEKTSQGKTIPYGFGLDIAKGENRFSFGHTGSWDGYATFVYHNMIKNRTIIVLENFKMGTYPFANINEILDNKPITEEFKKKIALPIDKFQQFVGTYIDENNDAQIITYLDGHLIHNSSKVAWDMRFFPVTENEFQGIRQGGTDAVLHFTKKEDGSTLLQMFQYGELIGSGIKK